MSTTHAIISVTSTVILAVAYWLNMTTIAKLRQQLREEQQLSQLRESALAQYRQIVATQNQTIESYIQTLRKRLEDTK